MAELQRQNTRINGAGIAPPADNVATAKRQRRPSVRLGEIGDEPAATKILFHVSHRRARHWKNPAVRSTRNPRLAMSGTGSSHQNPKTLDLGEKDEDSGSDNLAIGNWRTKKCKTKRAPRTHQRLKTGGAGGRNGEEDQKFGDYHDDKESGGDSEQSKDQSPAHSLENLKRQQSSSEIRAGEKRNHNIDGDGEIQLDSNGGVKDWLNGLGLGRYRPVFEIHEVDEGVLPWLTLEDLKDMGISAVGSRRKMFIAIQKLRKGFI